MDTRSESPSQGKATPGQNERRMFINDLGLGWDKVVVGYGVGLASGKEVNEDSYRPQKEETQRYHLVDYVIAGRLYLVADGVSRGLRGDQASDLAGEVIARAYYEQIFRLDRYPTDDDLEQALLRAIRQANQALLDESQRQRHRANITDPTSYLQTTVVCALLRNQTLLTAQVGDSRLYRLRKNEAAPERFEVTLLPAGRPTDNPYFVGTNLQEEHIDRSRHTLEPDDILLLCSDGLYKYLAPDNDPDRAAALIAGFRPTSQKGGLERLRDALFLQADDPQTHGGGDNITLMLIEPAARETGRAIETAAARAWRQTSPSTPDHEQNLAALGQLCARRAGQLAGAGDGPGSEPWRRRAAQLGAQPAPGAAELKEAQNLIKDVALDFEQNKEIVDQIHALYRRAPGNTQLARLTLDATADLANLILIEENETTSKVKIGSVLNSLEALHKQVGPALEADKQAQIGDLIRQLRQKLAGAGDDPPGYERANREADPAQSGLPAGAKDHDSKPSSSDAGARPASDKKKPGSGSSGGQNQPDEEEAAGNRVRFGSLIGLIRPPWTLKFRDIGLLGIVVTILIAAAFGLGFLLGRDAPAIAEARRTPLPDTPVSSTGPPAQASPEAGPVEATLSPTAPPPTSSALTAGLKIVEINPEAVTIPEGRNQIKLTARLAFTGSTAALDPAAEIVVRTLAPPTLSFSAGQPEPDRSALPQAPLIQRVPLANVDPQNMAFQALFVIEPPRLTQPAYTFTVRGELIGPDQTVLAAVEHTTEPVSIEHQAALSVTQTITPAAAAFGVGPITYTLTLRNEGQTHLDRLQIDPQQSRLAGLLLASSSELTALLDGVSLEPGARQTVTVSTQIATDTLGLISPTLAVRGTLADGTATPVKNAPARLVVYVAGVTVLPEGDFGLPHYLRAGPGSGSASNERLTELNENGVPVRVYGAAEAEGRIWYYVAAPGSQGEPVTGWLWSNRVQFPEDREAALKRDLEKIALKRDTDE